MSWTIVFGHVAGRAVPNSVINALGRTVPPAKEMTSTAEVMLRLYLSKVPEHDVCRYIKALVEDKSRAWAVTYMKFEDVYSYIFWWKALHAHGNSMFPIAAHGRIRK